MLLKKLSQSSGVSGNEGEIRQVIIEEIREYVDKISIDKIGNIIAFKKGTNPSCRLMLSSHMDEIGLIVTNIDDCGLIKFSPVGDVDKRTLLSKQVFIGNNKVLGVIGGKPIHLQKQNEREKFLDFKDMYIDIGVKSKDDAEKLVSIGDYISFNTDFYLVNNTLLKGKALDSRSGCNILIDLTKNDYKNDIYFVFTVMNKIGVRGAGPAAFQINPDLAIVLESTETDDMVENKEHIPKITLGKGPVLGLMGKNIIYNEELKKIIIRISKKNNIDIQYQTDSKHLSDAFAIQTSATGIKVASISVPVRYMYSFNKLISKNDYDNFKKLLDLFLKEYNK